jgi:hypothetical protein
VSISSIVAVRNATGLSQARFAALLGVSVRTLYASGVGARVLHGQSYCRGEAVYPPGFLIRKLFSTLASFFI